MARKGVDWEVGFFFFFLFLLVKGKMTLKKKQKQVVLVRSWRTKEISGSRMMHR